MDVGEILAELKSIGAVDAPKEPAAEIVITPIVEVRSEPLPAAPIHEIFKALETIRINLMVLVEGRIDVAAVPAVSPEVPAPVKAKSKVSKRVAKAAVPALIESEVETPVVAAPAPARSAPTTLEQARARAIARIRGEDLPTTPGALGEDAEDKLLFVGQDRAIPINLREAESVSPREAMVGSP